MMRSAVLAIALGLFWLLLSGHYTTLLLVLGVLSIALCVYMAARMGTLDEEGVPSELFLGALMYYPWLAVEICKSSWAVGKIILSPKLEISPQMFEVSAGQKSRTAVNIYANSITLTPGTITVDVADDVLTVHALTREGADDLRSGAMDARVRRLEGEA